MLPKVHIKPRQNSQTPSHWSHSDSRTLTARAWTQTTRWCFWLPLLLVMHRLWLSCCRKSVNVRASHRQCLEVQQHSFEDKRTSWNNPTLTQECSLYTISIANQISWIYPLRLRSCVAAEDCGYFSEHCWLYLSTLQGTNVQKASLDLKA